MNEEATDEGRKPTSNSNCDSQMLNAKCQMLKSKSQNADSNCGRDVRRPDNASDNVGRLELCIEMSNVNKRECSPGAIISRA